MTAGRRVEATEVAERAGNSVEVLLSWYVKCLDGRQEVANRRIEDLLREYECKRLGGMGCRAAGSSASVSGPEHPPSAYGRVVVPVTVHTEHTRATRVLGDLPIFGRYGIRGEGRFNTC